MKKYLPSKNFFYTIIVFVVLGIILLLIFNFSPQKKLFFFSNNEKGGLRAKRLTINELIQEDTDSDGVLDWEEALWGTDKNNKATFDTVSDKIYVEQKKKELKIDENITDDNLTETEKFAREFFASFVALKASGEIDQETINNFSNALGQKIIYPSLIDSYSIKDVKNVDFNENTEGRIEYYLNLKKLFENYKSKGVGDELNIVTNILTSPETSVDKYDKLITIANSYQDFAKKILKINVPQSLTEYHLKIANSSNNTGISVMNMTKISNDPIIGLSGLSQYQKYSEELINAVKDLEEKLKK